MTVALPLDWPKCGAKTRFGEPCDQIGAGWNHRCRWHGGLAIPPGDWVVLHTRSGMFLWNRADKSAEKVRVSWMIAAMLIEAGKVRRALFSRRGGGSILTRLASRRVTVRPIMLRKFMREYEFEPCPT